MLGILNALAKKTQLWRGKVISKSGEEISPEWRIELDFFDNPYEHWIQCEAPGLLKTKIFLDAR
jgi:hypothetical protein